MRLHHYLHIWHLSCPHLLAETPTSHVYTVRHRGTTAVLKLLTPLGEQDEANGAAALRYFGGQGAVRLLRCDGQAHLLEYAEGEDLTTLVRRGDDERATATIACLLNTLHRPHRHPPPAALTPLKRWFRALFERDTHYLCSKAASIAQALLDQPREVCVLHGDIHHANIRHSAGRGWLAIDPKGLIGERTYDAANTLCNPIELPALVENEARLMKNAEILAQRSALDLSRLLRFVFVYACLSASWSLEDGKVPYHALKMAEIAQTVGGLG